MSDEAKRREKEYLSRSGSLEWERIKPFSPAGHDTVGESVRLMHDFAVAVHGLDAAGNHLILDIGAGACWTSEWLRRLNLDVVSVDIAHDMLKVGRERAAGGGWPLVGGDLDALPFADGAFDRALCMNALHHLPDPERALREIARVLDEAGRLVLIEPGGGHAANPTSVKAVEDFGVMERELEASELMAMCARAGFATVHLRPLSYATGEIELSADQVARWRTWTRTKRPLRAAAKMRLAALEFLGRRKATELFEDSLSMWVARVLLRHVGEQGVVVASKTGYGPSAEQFRATLRLDPACAVHLHDRTVVCRVQVENAGSAAWRTTGRRRGRVRLGVKTLHGDGAENAVDTARFDLPAGLTAGARCAVDVRVPLPESPDARALKLDLVAEDVAWFESKGSRPLVLPVAAATVL